MTKEHLAKKIIEIVNNYNDAREIDTITLEGMELVFVNECAHDGCYKKNAKGKQMCKEHQAKYDAGEKLKAFYGKTVQKNIALKTNN